MMAPYMGFLFIAIGFSIMYVFRNIIEPRWQREREGRPVKYNEKGINISGGVLRGIPGKCDNKCHGTNEEYRYNDIFPLQGIHDLDVRLTKIENTNDVYWSDKIKDLIDTFPNASSVPMKYAWNTSQEYYTRLKTFEKFNNCKKCKEENENFIKENMEYIAKHSLYIKQECKCKEQNEQS